MLPRWATGLLIRVAALFNREQAVIVQFDYGSTDLRPLRDLESQLEKAIESAGAGDFDGDEIETSGRDGYLYMYGRSADELFDVIHPILRGSPFMHGAKVTKIYGLPGTSARRTELTIAP